MNGDRVSADALWRAGDLRGAVDAASALGKDLSASPGDLTSAAFVLMRANHLDIAEDLLRRAIASAPADAVGHSLVSQIGRARGAIETALSIARRAAVFPTRRAEASRSIGQMFELLGRDAEAEFWFRVAVEASGGSPSDQRWLADHLLRKGQAGDAWALIHRAEIASGSTDPRLADGLSGLDGETLIVDGDPEDIAACVYTSSWVPSLARDNQVILSAPPRLATTFRRSFPSLSIRTSGDSLDTEAKALRVGRWSLPRLLRETPAATPALRADPARQAFWRNALSRQFGQRKIVGISWRSSLTLRPGAFDPPRAQRLADLHRSATSSAGEAARLWRKHVPLGAFDSVFSDREVQTVSVQYGVDAAEVAYIGGKLGLPLAFPPLDFLADLDDVTALLASLDAIITIPNTHAHLAAALGTPTVVLCHETPTAVWGLMRHRPHYERAEFVRKPIQRRPDDTIVNGWAGDWSDTVARALGAVRRMLGLADRETTSS